VWGYGDCLDEIIYMQHGGTVYILTNGNNTVLYIGVTADMFRRLPEHRNKINKISFTARYNCNKLVYYETYGRIEEAIAREKQLKKWNRQWKDELINKMNPEWTDLFEEL
jgi:putative endonuclease